MLYYYLVYFPIFTLSEEDKPNEFFVYEELKTNGFWSTTALRESTEILTS